jgi:hypothetical protein
MWCALEMFIGGRARCCSTHPSSESVKKLCCWLHRSPRMRSSKFVLESSVKFDDAPGKAKRNVRNRPPTVGGIRLAPIRSGKGHRSRRCSALRVLALTGRFAGGLWQNNAALRRYCARIRNRSRDWRAWANRPPPGHMDPYTVAQRPHPDWQMGHGAATDTPRKAAAQVERAAVVARRLRALVRLDRSNRAESIALYGKASICAEPISIVWALKFINPLRPAFRSVPVSHRGSWRPLLARR